MDLNILGEILRGGAEKVAEAGGILAGGHSIADTGVKYGLSVTGLVDPRRLTANDTGKPGDKLILTKRWVWASSARPTAWAKLPPVRWMPPWPL